MHLADWVPTLLGLAGVEPPTGEIILIFDICDVDNLYNHFDNPCWDSLGLIILIFDIFDAGHVDNHFDNRPCWDSLGFNLPLVRLS